MKNDSILRPLEGVKWVWHSKKTKSQRPLKENVAHQEFPMKLTGNLSLTWHGTSSGCTVYYLEYLPKIICDSCLIRQLNEIVAVNGNKNWPKVITENMKRKLSCASMGFMHLQWVSVNLEVYIRSRWCTYRKGKGTVYYFPPAHYNVQVGSKD